METAPTPSTTPPTFPPGSDVSECGQWEVGPGDQPVRVGTDLAPWEADLLVAAQTLSAYPVAVPSRSLRTPTGRPVNLRKPSYALVYAGTSNGGDHDLELRGTPVRITADTVTIKVAMVKGGETGILYTDRFPFLVGQRATVAREDAILFM